MKFKSFLAVAILTLSASFGANAQDKDGHVLTSLWKNYQSYVDSDKPKKQLEVLEQIKKEAMSKRLAWDYYDAAAKAVDVRAGINWKDRSAAKDEFKAGVESFDEPILTFWYSRNQEYKNAGYYAGFAKDNRKRLEKGHNTQFYADYLKRGYSPYHLVADALLECVDNDYEFMLWCVSAMTTAYSDKAVCPGRDLLADYIGGDYPEIAILDYLNASEKNDNKEPLAEFVAKYKGKGAALLGEADLLQIKFNKLNEGKAGQDAYKALRDECASFEKRRSKLTGTDKNLLSNCNTVASLINRLDSKSVELEVKDGCVTVSMRNVDKVSLSVESDVSSNKSVVVHNKLVKNPVCSYYVMDTVKYELPAFNDGVYEVKAEYGTESAYALLDKYSISYVWRRDSKGISVFAADYRTGRPVGTADIVVSDPKNDGKEIKRLSGFRMNGFTMLPSDFVSFLEKNNDANVRLEYVDESGVKHLSLTRRGVPAIGKEYDDEVHDCSEVFVDRTAFNPDETVRFKVVGYSGVHKDFATMPAGQKLQVKLMKGWDGVVVEEKTLTLNEFGSATGSFYLPRQSRNQTYYIRVFKDGKLIGTGTYLTVDDFVLPNFDLLFDNSRTLFVSGDTITVTGTIKAYSGHSLANAKVTYTTIGLKEVSGDVTVEPDGRFCIEIPASKKDYPYDNVFALIVKVVDATGETKEFRTECFLHSNMSLSSELVNKAGGSCELPRIGKIMILQDNVAVVRFGVMRGRSSHATSGVRGPIDVRYTVCDESGKAVLSGDAQLDSDTEIDMGSLPGGVYTINSESSVLDCDGKAVTGKSTLRIMKLAREDKVLPGKVENLFIPYQDGERIGLRFGAGSGEVWACVELVGYGFTILDSRLVHLDGEAGKPGSLVDLDWEYRHEWGEAVTLKVIYFRNSRQYQYTTEYRRVETRDYSLPVEFTRFLDMTAPAGKYDFRFRTSPEAECVVTVFDKSTEQIAKNKWETISRYDRSAPRIDYSYWTGEYESKPMYLMMNDMALDEVVAVRGTKASVVYKSVAANSADGGLTEYVVEDVVEEEALPFMITDMEFPTSFKDVRIRENFANTLAFEPFLYPDKSGEVTVPVETSDKLSTYYFQVYAHDKSMNNSTVRQEFKVTVPVKLSIVQPQYLYTGDRYVLKASLSSNAAEQVDGKVYCQIYDRGNYKEAEAVKTFCLPVSVAANGGAAAEFETDVPEGVDSLGFKVTFVPDSAESPYSDAVFVAVPVYMNWQTLTEAHSAILLDGISRDDLLAELRSRFVNTSAYGAEHTEKSILDMVKDAIPSLRTPESDNVLALVDALYANAMSASLGMGDSALEQTALMERILKCWNSDGGFGWFEGMDSSPVIVAVILQRFDGLRRRGLVSALGDLSFLDEAVKYLDSSYFAAKQRPFWCGGLSLEQYLSTRSLYTSVPLSAKVKASVKKSIKSYLTPKKERGLNGRILMKARRVRILRNLSASADGLALAKAWGLGSNARKLTKSLAADVASLEEYAVKHPEAGTYFPNAVMPFRGLMESELYAHSYLCDLFRDLGNTEIADGVRIWIMLQKETQQWSDDPAYVDAVASVMDGSPAALDTRVIILSKSYRKPFAEIKAAGNGFTLAREYRLEGSETALKDGDTLKVGDKIIASYKIWNAENRSFIKLSVPRYACLRPVDQFSGRYGWWLRPLRVSGWYSFSPQGYRSVLADRTEYWFDAYPEENTVITEAFYVTQSGTFTTPVAEIESLYAPHYRAVAGYDGIVNTR